MLSNFSLDPLLPLLPLPGFLPGGEAPYLPNTPTSNVFPQRIIYPQWGSPISVLSYQCLPQQPYSALYVLPPSDPPSLLSRLMDSCRRCILAYAKIASTVTLICSSSALCLNHGTWSLSPPFYPVPCAHTSKTGGVEIHYATVACLIATNFLRVCVPTPSVTASSST